jgi:CBS domain-containing protein
MRNRSRQPLSIPHSARAFDLARSNFTSPRAAAGRHLKARFMLSTRVETCAHSRDERLGVAPHARCWRRADHPGNTPNYQKKTRWNMSVIDKVVQGQPTATKHAQRVKDVMNPDIMTVGDDMTTGELVRFLNEREISGAPVVDSQGHFIGVVSMTDVGRHLAEPSDFEPTRAEFYRDIDDDVTLEDLGQHYVEGRAVTVRDVMTPVIHHVAATAPVAEAARIMVDRHIHRLVVTQGRQPVGMITSTDLLRVVADQS